MDGDSWVTLATNDSSAVCTLVLAYSLKKVNTAKKITILVTNGVSPLIRPELDKVFDYVSVIDTVSIEDDNPIMARNPALLNFYAKIHCWKLSLYRKCVFLCDHVLVLKNCDELFDHEELSAVPDSGWPDFFETGVFVFKPSIETFNQIADLALQDESCVDESVLMNEYFSNWRCGNLSRLLPFCYNTTFTSVDNHPPAYKRFIHNSKIVHFLNEASPLSCSLNWRKITKLPESHPLHESIELWFKLFQTHVHPVLSPGMEGAAGHLAKLKFDSQDLDDRERYEAWGVGKMDYTGQDCFDNILAKLNITVNEGEKRPKPK